MNRNKCNECGSTTVKIIKDYFVKRLIQLNNQENKIKISNLENERKRHPAWKQLTGRIKEVEKVLADIKGGRL